MFMRSGGNSLDAHCTCINMSQKESSEVASSGKMMKSPTTASDRSESAYLSSSQVESYVLPLRMTMKLGAIASSIRISSRRNIFELSRQYTSPGNAKVFLSSSKDTKLNTKGIAFLETDQVIRQAGNLMAARGQLPVPPNPGNTPRTEKHTYASLATANARW